ncbi:MAG: hypothetical protein ACN6RJ_07095 [Stenotrophomonas sp.]
MRPKRAFQLAGDDGHGRQCRRLPGKKALAQAGLFELLLQAIHAQRMRGDPCGHHIDHPARPVAQLQAIGRVFNQTFIP